MDCCRKLLVYLPFVLGGGVFVTLFSVLPSSPAGERLATDGFQSGGNLEMANRGSGFRAPWKLSGLRPARSIPSGVMLGGTGGRNNPLRRELAEPHRKGELFVRFQFRYEPEESGQEDLSEFFVLWLDRLDGGDRSLHATSVPNIGVHVADRGPKKGKVVFMARFNSAQTAWSNVELERGRSYQVVARLSKSEQTERADFDQLDLWVDPGMEDRESPAASVRHKESVNVVRWVGFSTGIKTESTDRILLQELVLSRSWEDVLEEGSSSSERDDSGPVERLPEVVWEKPVHFKRDVYPLLKSRCFECHAGQNPESGYRLDVRSELLGFSTGEPLVQPGRGEQSRLLELVTAPSPEDRMPPLGEGKKLTDLEVALLRAWIDQGLSWDEKLLPEPNADSDHWAFQAIERPELPPRPRGEWGRNEVDRFVAAGHEAKGLTPAPDADRRTLIRRLSLDLIGLPPSMAEVEEFVADENPDAYRSLVDRLLASPHYGERWGRYWLDLARWAESHGYQHDLPRPYAWRYRDYVIDSFNQDKPYDQFLREQIAGDELRPVRDEHLIATGFLGAARISGNQMDKAIQRNDVLVDIVNATGSAVLGLTLECAQCHNHKFDPISQRDYYRFQAFFVSGQLGNLELEGEGLANPTNLEQWMSKGTYDFYRREAAKLVKRKMFQETAEPHTWGFYSPLTGVPGVKRLPVVNRDPIPYQPASLRETKARLLLRGDVAKPGPEVQAGWPLVLGKTPEEDAPLARTRLADWLGSRGNPLVARVWANRIWQYHFGRGIVATASDFGAQGAKPSHPELLDWLAVELMEHGWSTKHLHREIVLSSAYRQARHYREDNARLDPANQMLWQWPNRRLEAEAIRDSILRVTGELDPSVGGPSTGPEREELALRRTLYLAQRRSEMPPAMTMFDGPEGVTSCAKRGISTVALQPLYLLNSEFMARRAQGLARRVKAEAGEEPHRWIEVAFRRVLSREPDEEEAQRARTMILSWQEEEDAEAETNQRFHAFCLALLNLNEFVYLP